MYDKVCVDCGSSYKATGPAAKYCESCAAQRKELEKKKKRIRAEKRRRKKGCRIGRGALPGDQHPMYKHGYYVAQTQARWYKHLAEHTCERCGKDLEHVNKWQWVVHHKDHDHSNHDINNLELLCKSCHQKEHNCSDNLKVQRLSDTE